MTHEKIFKREDGTQYQIVASFYISSYRNDSPEYIITCYTRGKGKKKWLPLPDETTNWEYRKLSMEEKVKLSQANNLRFVTAKEIQETKLELWEKLKPTLTLTV